MTVYDKLMNAGIQISNHESDLYCEATKEALAILRSEKVHLRFFKNNIDGKTWCDIPFAFTPWWNRRAKR